MPRDVFVTGGNGFIGSTTVRRLVAAGHRVTCLLRPTSRTDRIDDLAIRRVAGDVLDPESLRAGMAGSDATIHLAAPSSWEDDAASGAEEIIVAGTRNVLAAAEGIAGHRVVVVSSTAAINASETPRVFDERTPFEITDPSLLYAFAKRRAEQETAAAVARGVAAVIVNPAEVYGPGDTSLVTAENLLDFATSRPVLVCRGGTGIVHVDDVAGGIIAALERGRPGERYILSGENVTIRELATLCNALLGRRATVVTVPRPLVRALATLGIRFHLPLPFNAYVVPYATRYWFVDGAKATRELGVTFRPARDTVQSTLAWMTEAGLLRRHG